MGEQMTNQYMPHVSRRQYWEISQRWENGERVVDLAREHGIATVTIYKRMRTIKFLIKYGGVDSVERWIAKVDGLQKKKEKPLGFKAALKIVIALAEAKAKAETVVVQDAELKAISRVRKFVYGTDRWER